MRYMSMLALRPMRLEAEAKGEGGGSKSRQRKSLIRSSIKLARMHRGEMPEHSRKKSNSLPQWTSSLR